MIYHSYVTDEGQRDKPRSLFVTNACYNGRGPSDSQTTLIRDQGAHVWVYNFEQYKITRSLERQATGLITH